MKTKFEWKKLVNIVIEMQKKLFKTWPFFNQNLYFINLLLFEKVFKMIGDTFLSSDI